MKKLLVLPGNRWQLELVKKIKEMGNAAYVVSPEINPPCKAIADDYLRSDIFDEERICQYIEKMRPDGIVSDECDIAMPVIARLGEKYGLNTLSQKEAALYTNKFLMREFLKKHGFPVPKYKLCHTSDEAGDFLKEVGAPIIIKPIDCNASKGVYTASSCSEISLHYEECASFSKADAAVLAEQYIDGTEFTIDGIKTPGRHYTLAISQKHHFEHNHNIADELFFTHSNNMYDYEELKKVNDAFVMKSNLRFGFTHAEYKYANGQFYMIEIAARGGGTMISSVITQFMSGHDTYPYLIRCALGECKDFDFTISETKSRAAVLKFFVTPGQGGVVKEIAGLERLSKNPHVACFQLNFKEGDYIENCSSDSARIGFYIACAESKQQLIEVMDQIEAGFRIIMES